jgi:SdpC family antimicrobial peptide
MKKIFLFAIPALASIAIISCSKENLNPTKTNSSSSNVSSPSASSALNSRLATSQQTYSDVDLFLGIFFLKGGVANEVDALVNLKTQLNNGELNTLSNRGDNVVDFINNARPGFFDTFAKQIRSGDQKSVSAGIDFAVQTLIELGISNGEGTHVAAELEAGKNCHKWIVRTHFLILRKFAELSLNTGNINAPEVGIEKEILVNDIVTSLQQ